MDVYIVKILGTHLWMKVRTIYTGHLYTASEKAITWVVSPLEASRYKTIEVANEAAAEGIAEGHWTLHRLLESTKPVFEFNTIPKPVDVVVKVEHVEKRSSCWLKRAFNGEGILN